MKIRVDKCLTFGIKKASASSVQYLLKLVLHHDLVPTVDIGKSFKYTGRHFNFTMDNHILISEVIDIFSGLLKKASLITITSLIPSKILLSADILTSIPVHLPSSLSRKNISSSVFHHMMKTIAYSIPSIGFNLRMKQRWLLLLNAKINL